MTSSNITLAALKTRGTVCVLALFLLLVLNTATVLAQNTALYQDPAGRFSVPIPPDWTDESTPEIGRFVSSDDLALSILSIEAADSESGDQTVLATLVPDLADAAPLQTTSQPASQGMWTVNIYAPVPDRLVILATQWVDGVTYALLFDMSQAAFAAHQGELLTLFNQFIMGERPDLTGIELQPFTAETRVELAAYIEEARQEFHISGLSIAIVQNGAVVYADGFGMTESGSDQPVTAETLFMIGSVTKSMTTMMMGTLVDEGMLNWDQPVTDLMPTFALSDPAATAQIRVRDLVNMTSGVPRYDIISSLADFTPQQLVSSLTQIPLVAAPGETWNYNNQMVATAGYLSALVAGAPLDSLYEGYVKLVQDRVFDAIGMPATTFDFSRATANPNHALPYTYDQVTQNYIPVRLENERFTGPIAPAGAVWSNAEDMARYLQTELSGGVSPDGVRVISEDTLRATQSAEITPGGLYAGYGMGWGIDSYNGLPMISHGGNTLGFTSDLAFLPDADFGVVILTDAAEANSFTAMLRLYIFEQAFGLDHEVSTSLASAHVAQEAQRTIPSSPLPELDPETVTPYLGVYEHGETLEMRGAELWFVGAFVETRLYPTGEAENYSGSGAYSALGVRLVEAGSSFTLEISYPGNPVLALNRAK